MVPIYLFSTRCSSPRWFSCFCLKVPSAGPAVCFLGRKQRVPASMPENMWHIGWRVRQTPSKNSMSPYGEPSRHPKATTGILPRSLTGRLPASAGAVPCGITAGRETMSQPSMRSTTPLRQCWIGAGAFPEIFPPILRTAASTFPHFWPPPMRNLPLCFAAANIRAA
ncbi:hypothetical protein SDC9_126345 [bioreactor metagenome]|uniref:Uncharacterized protein n=1 Tax=bioreactor metagenome TaxID=1076179 RepID=A0A645CRG6_9ZZZZ